MTNTRELERLSAAMTEGRVMESRGSDQPQGRVISDQQLEEHVEDDTQAKRVTTEGAGTPANGSRTSETSWDPLSHSDRYRFSIVYDDRTAPEVCLLSQ